jgi:hypothetical protein
LEDLKSKLKNLFISISNIFHLHYKKIGKLETEVEILKHQLKSQENSKKQMEKTKLIGDLLVPLSKVSLIR